MIKPSAMREHLKNIRRPCAALRFAVLEVDLEGSVNLRLSCHEGAEVRVSRNRGSEERGGFIAVAELWHVERWDGQRYMDWVVKYEATRLVCKRCWKESEKNEEG
jgi:hypothetical protein